MSSKQLSRIAFTFGLCMVCCCLTLAGSYQSLFTRLQSAHDAESVRSAVHAEGLDRDLGATLSKPFDVETFKESIRLRAHLESASGQSSADTRGPGELTTEIKRDPLFRSVGEERSNNWLGRALSKLKYRPPRQTYTPALGNLGSGLNIIVWIILGGLALAFLGLAIWFFSTKFGRTKRRLVSQILEEDEPLRSSDEWLLIGDTAQAAGNQREAVRAYYLAALLRMDERQMLRFERTETNWQHLRRLHRSPHAEALTFDQPTRRFDDIWFGWRSTDPQELGFFRSLVEKVDQVAKLKSAATPLSTGGQP